MSARHDDHDADLAGDHVPTILSLLCVIADGLREMNGHLAAMREASAKKGTTATKDALLGPGELANSLNVSPRTIQRMRAAGELPKHVGTDARPKWRRSDVEAFVSKLKAKR